MGFKIPLPENTEEQAAIAAILSDMDKEIQIPQQRLDKKPASLSKGMMQELLTGKIPLNIERESTWFMITAPASTRKSSDSGVSSIGTISRGFWITGCTRQQSGAGGKLDQYRQPGLIGKRAGHPGTRRNGQDTVRLYCRFILPLLANADEHPQRARRH